MPTLHFQRYAYTGLLALSGITLNGVTLAWAQGSTATVPSPASSMPAEIVDPAGAQASQAAGATHPDDSDAAASSPHKARHHKHRHHTRNQTTDDGQASGPSGTPDGTNGADIAPSGGASSAMP